MPDAHKKRTHRPSHKLRHHDPVKKQEILERVDALLEEKPAQEKTEAEDESVAADAAPVQEVSGGTTPPLSSPSEQQVSAVASGQTPPSPESQSPAQPSQPQQVPALENVQAPSSTQPSSQEATTQPSATDESVNLVAGSPTVSPAQNNTQNSPSSGQTTEAVAPPWRNVGEAEPVLENDSSLKKKILTILLFLVILAVSVGGGYLIYSKVLRKELASSNQTQDQTKSSSATSISPKVTSTPSIAPTEKPVDLSKYDIKVLNGSGKKGVAAIVKTMLEEEKFVVVQVGNADASDYTKTVIRARKDIDDSYLKKLKEVLGKSYVIAGVQEIDENEKADVVVIVGSSTVE